MEVLESIKNRRSVRKYKNKPLTKEQIEEVIEAGRLAPTARNEQNLKFIVVTNKDLIKDMSDYVVNIVIDNPKYHFVKERKALIEDPILYSAPAVVFITAPKDDKWGSINCALAAQNMMVFAYSKGIGSCFIGMARFVTENQDFLTKLKVKEDHSVHATVIFGYADEQPEMKERKTDNLSFIE